MLHRAVKEIARLTNYLMKAWPDEIGTGDPVRGESAVDVAIRLLRKVEDKKAGSDEGCGCLFICLGIATIVWALSGFPGLG